MRGITVAMWGGGRGGNVANQGENARNWGVRMREIRVIIFVKEWK